MDLALNLGRRLKAIPTVLAAGVFVLTSWSSPAPAQEAYKLGPGDRVRVNVSDWSASGGEARTRLNGEFTVSPSGDIAFPLIGQMQAAGLTTVELSRSVSEQMKTRAGLLNEPVSSVEVIGYRPFYILGDVERPGEYPYRPGMLVIHAVSISGGLYRRTDTSLLRLGLDAISARGDARVYEATLDELTARRARLQAERDGRDTILYPAELMQRKEDPSVVQVMRQEEALMKARQEAFSTDIDTREQLQKAADQEASSLREQLSAQDQRAAVLRKELEETKSLVNRGLAPAPRQLTVEGAVADAEFRKRDLQTQLLRATQESIKESQAIRTLRNQRQTELLSELEQVDRSLRETANKLSTARTLVRETAEAADTYSPSDPASELSPSYVILREVSGQTQEIPATDVTPVLPGDVIKVPKGSAGEGNTVEPMPRQTQAAPRRGAGTTQPVSPTR